MERWKGKVAVVTGASSGIGACIATSLVKIGMKVVGCARRVERLQVAKDIENQCSDIKTKDNMLNQLNNQTGKMFAVKCDIQSEHDIQNLFQFIDQHEELGHVDLCINCAGIATPNSLLEETYTNWRSMMDVNVLGPALFTQLSVKLMLKRGINDGQIININSFSGHNVVNFAHSRFYSATKFALRALTEGWRQEMREINSNIRVSSISPGFCTTEFGANWYKDKPELQDLLPRTGLTAQDIRDSVYHILSSPQSVEIADIIVTPNR